MVSPFKEIKVDEVLVKIYKNRDEMGKAAAFDVAERIREIARVKDTINIVFAAAPSQNEFLSYLNME
ncbi:MAG TPA: glucosamine-6-phosphate deaminase, partial [bacterium]|nr:glucosamine-6-phosphate deaminase [bacterium]